MWPSCCVHCGRNMAHLQIPYNEYHEKVWLDPKLSDDEKSELVSKFIKGFNLGRCCNPTILTYLDIVKIIRNE